MLASMVLGVERGLSVCVVDNNVVAEDGQSV